MEQAGLLAVVGEVTEALELHHLAGCPSVVTDTAHGTPRTPQAKGWEIEREPPSPPLAGQGKG